MSCPRNQYAVLFKWFQYDTHIYSVLNFPDGPIGKTQEYIAKTRIKTPDRNPESSSDCYSDLQRLEHPHSSSESGGQLARGLQGDVRAHRRVCLGRAGISESDMH